METAQYTPVFELVPAFDNGYEGRARNAFMADCLRGVIEYNVPPPGDHEALFSRDHQLMFNEEIAAEWGYPGSRLPRQEAPGVDPEKVTPEIETEIERCGNEIPAEFRAPAPNILNDLTGAGWGEISANPAVEEATAAWHECMLPLGLVDLPDGPDEMPPTSVRGLSNEEFGYADQELELTEKERSIAIADARCRTESNYDEAFFRARAEGELVAIGKNIEEFEASRTAYEEYEKQIDAVLAELG